MQEEREALLEDLVEVLQEHIWYGHRRVMAAEEEVGLTIPQAVVLKELQRCGEPCAMQELSELSLQSCAGLTGVVDRLVKMGLVARVPYTQDRRVVTVALTPQGEARHEVAQQHVKALIAEDTQEFTDEDLRQLIALLQKLLQGMKSTV